MEEKVPHAERRRCPRISMDLPIEFQMMNVQRPYGGLAVNASEVGLLINSVKNIPIGAKLNIAVLYPKEFELDHFEVLAEIIWKDFYWDEDWEGYQYGLKFVKMIEEEQGKLKQLLSRPFE